MRVLLLLLMFGICSPAWADNEPISVRPKSGPNGYFVALGLHGLAAVIDDVDRGVRGPGVGSGYTLRLGERLWNRLEVGIEFAYANVWEDTPWRFGHVVAQVQGYVYEPLFVVVGLGVGGSDGEDPKDPRFRRFHIGTAFTLGVGAELWRADSWGVTPRFTLEVGRDDVLPNASAWFGLEIRYQWQHFRML